MSRLVDVVEVNHAADLVFRYSERFCDPGRISARFAHRSNFLSLFVRKARSALVSSLYNRAGPATVARLIVASRINPVQRSLWWPNTHVSKEGFKVTPPFANSYAGAAIESVCPASMVGAPLNHAIPRGVSRCFVHAVRTRSLLGAFRPHAAARSHKVLLQAVDSCHVLSAAVACAPPKAHTPLFFSCRHQCGELAKTKSGNVFNHGCIIDAVFLVCMGDATDGRR